MNSHPSINNNNTNNLEFEQRQAPSEQKANNSTWKGVKVAKQHNNLPIKAKTNEELPKADKLLDTHKINQQSSYAGLPKALNILLEDSENTTSSDTSQQTEQNENTTKNQEKQQTEAPVPKSEPHLNQNDSLNIRNCVSDLPQAKIDSMLPRMQQGYFLISARADGSLQFNFVKDTNLQVLPFKSDPDGSIHLENGKSFPSLSHLMASDDYRFLFVPIIFKNNAMCTEQMRSIFEKSWDMTLEQKNVSPADRQIIANLKVYIEAVTDEEKRAALSKLNMKAFDPKEFLEITAKIPEPFKGIFNREVIIFQVKMFCHEWGIGAKIQIGGQVIKTEGFHSEDAHRNLSTSVSEYLKGPLKDESALARLDPDFRKRMSDTITTSLVKSVDYSKDSPKAEQLLAEYKAKKPVTIGTGWFGHSVEVTLYDGYLCYTNRGARLNDEVLRQSNSKMKIFKIDDSKVSLELINKIMNSGEHKDESLKKDRMEWFEGGKGLHAELGIDINQPIALVEKSEQKVGNCSWANCKGGFHAELIVSLLKHNLEDKEKYPTFDAAFREAASLGTEIFKEWEYTNRSRSIDEIIHLEAETKRPDSTLSQRAYFQLLCELNAKAGRKGSDLTYVKLKPNPIIQKTNNEIISKLNRHFRNLDINIDNCIFNADLHDAISACTFMSDALPGDFLLAKDSQNQISLLLKTGMGFRETAIIPLKPNPNGSGCLLDGTTPIKSLKDLYQARQDLGLPRMVQKRLD